MKPVQLKHLDLFIIFKQYFIMKNITFFLAMLCFVAVSCTKEKTDYEAELGTTVPEQNEFKEAVSMSSQGYRISIESLNGTLKKGYNEIRLRITNAQTNEKVTTSTVHFLPLSTDGTGNTISCPHRPTLVYQSADQYYSGYVVFTHENTTDSAWKVYLNFTVGNQIIRTEQSVTVQQQPNKNLNMTMFTGKDNEQYVIALVAPQNPKVAENALIAGIYKFNTPTSAPAGTFPDSSQFSYSEVSGYTLQLDPRMPEPSMGNHSSPNNKDLTQQADGFYHGVVNYTMTGNWTLNFILLNTSGRIVMGTVVPPDFTPGTLGVKSELHIDILF